MKEHENRSVAVIEKHTFGGANTITLMKHKHRCAVRVKSIRLYGAYTAAMMFTTVAYSYDEF